MGGHPDYQNGRIPLADERANRVVIDAGVAIGDDAERARRTGNGLADGHANAPQSEVEGENRGWRGHSGVSGVRAHGGDVDARDQTPAPGYLDAVGALATTVFQHTLALDKPPEIDVMGVRVGATASLKPLYDPKSERVKV